MPKLDRLRRQLYPAAQTPLLNAAARRAYWFAAQTIAERFSGLAEITKVSLVRGMVNGIVPVLSDIDFHLHHREPHGPRTVCLLLKLRRLHQNLKRIFPMLGEMAVSSEGEHAGQKEKSTALLLESADRLTFHQGKWEKETVALSAPILHRERVTLFLKYFVYATPWPELLDKNRIFERARVLRYLTKANRLLSEPSGLATDLASSFSESYLNLHRLALKALDEPSEAGREVDLKIPTTASDSFHAVGSVFLERFLRREMGDAEIYPTALPFVFAVKATHQEKIAEELFSRVFSPTTRDQKNSRRWGAVFLSHESARCLARCFPLFLPSIYWGWFTSRRLNPHLLDTQNHLAQSLKTLLRWQQPAQPGIFASLGNSWSQPSLQTLMHAAVNLTAQRAAQLPLSHATLTRFERNVPVDDYELARAVDGVGEEIYEWVKNNSW